MEVMSCLCQDRSSALRGHRSCPMNPTSFLPFPTSIRANCSHGQLCAPTIVSLGHATPNPLPHLSPQKLAILKPIFSAFHPANLLKVYGRK